MAATRVGVSFSRLVLTPKSIFFSQRRAGKKWPSFVLFFWKSLSGGNQNSRYCLLTQWDVLCPPAGLLLPDPAWEDHLMQQQQQLLSLTRAPWLLPRHQPVMGAQLRSLSAPSAADIYRRPPSPPLWPWAAAGVVTAIYRIHYFKQCTCESIICLDSLLGCIQRRAAQ